MADFLIEQIPLLSDAASLPPYTSREETANEKASRSQSTRDNNTSSIKGRSVSRRWMKSITTSRGTTEVEKYQARYEVVSPSNHHDIIYVISADTRTRYMYLRHASTQQQYLPTTARVANWFAELFASVERPYFLRLIPESADDESKKLMPELMVIGKVWTKKPATKTQLERLERHVASLDLIEEAKVDDKCTIGTTLKNLIAAKEDADALLAEVENLANQLQEAKHNVELLENLHMKCPGCTGSAHLTEQLQNGKDRVTVLERIFTERVQAMKTHCQALGKVTIQLGEQADNVASELAGTDDNSAIRYHWRMVEQFIGDWCKNERTATDLGVSREGLRAFWVLYLHPMLRSKYGRANKSSYRLARILSEAEILEKPRLLRLAQ